MRMILLNKNKFCVVDDEDYGWLKQHNWWMHNSRGILYPVCKINGRRFFMHRMIMSQHYDLQSTEKVDHIDRIPHNNQKHNLRICHQSQNRLNSIGKKKSSSKFKGVSYRKDIEKWRVRIYLNNRLLKNKTCDTELEAAQLYDQWAIKYHKEFARLNFK